MGLSDTNPTYDVIDYCMEFPKCEDPHRDSQYTQHNFVRKCQDLKHGWGIKDELDDGMTFTGKFVVIAYVKGHRFYPKGKKWIDPHTGHQFRQQHDEWDHVMQMVNISNLFEMRMNLERTVAYVMPKSRNARTWMLNHQLEVTVEVKMPNE